MSNNELKIKKLGNQTVKLQNPPKIIATYSIVGPKEGEGPLSSYFDEILNDDMYGKESYEKAESEMMYTAITAAMNRADLKEEDIDYLFAGDLLNQITSSSLRQESLTFLFLDYMELAQLCQNL